MIKYKRSDYMAGLVSHREYYGQFVNEDVKARVAAVIGLDSLLRSKDEYLNDIPMRKWDSLGGFSWTIRGGEEVATTRPHNSADIEPVIYADLKEAGDGISCAGMVCIYKEAARQMIEEARK